MNDRRRRDFFHSPQRTQALRQVMRRWGRPAGALAVAGALAIAAAPGAALAATHAVPAGSHYFADFTWSTFSTSTLPDPETAVEQDPVTGGWLAGISFGVSAPNPDYPKTSRYFDAGWDSPGNLPVDTDFPASGTDLHNVGKNNGAGLSFGFTYTFAQAIPSGTHVFIQDLDGYEEATLTFKACGSGAVVNPSGWDYLKLSADPATDHITTTFGATDIQLVSYVEGGRGRLEPTVAIVVRNVGVCQIELVGKVPTGSYSLYFAVPPTDLGVVKTSSVSSFYKGGPVQWTLTATNTSPAQSGIPGVANPTQAYGVTLTDAVDPAVSGVTASIADAGGTTGGACTVGAGNAVSCSGFSPLAHGASIVVKVSGTLAADYAGSTLANTAVLASTAPIDPNPDNNTSTVEIGTAAAPAPVSTLSEWMLLGLGLLMAGLAWVRVRAATHRV